MFSPKSRDCSSEAAPGRHCFHRLQLHRFISANRKLNRTAYSLLAMPLGLLIPSRAMESLWLCKAERWSRSPLFHFCADHVHSTKHISNITRHIISGLRRHFAMQPAYGTHWLRQDGSAMLRWALLLYQEWERC